MNVGVFGARSLVGQRLLSQLLMSNVQVIAFSRQVLSSGQSGFTWQRLPGRAPTMAPSISLWISLAPIWVLSEYFPFLESCGARKVVALSSTSRFTKGQSESIEEQRLAERLADAEMQFQQWAEGLGIEWVILRPTLIYGLGQDKNISEISRFISRFRFFPLFGKALGLRQPIHADDVASACLAALHSSQAKNHAYNITGSETLTYYEMVSRIFAALGLPPRFLHVPLWLFRIAVALLRCVPRYRNWTASMAERMNQDLVFDHAEASRDFAFAPKPFIVAGEGVSAVESI